MADLSDDISDSINRNLMELVRNLMRRWNMSHYGNYEKLTREQRQLKKQMGKWNRAHPDDPYRELSFKGAKPPHTAKDFAKALDERGYGDVRVYKHFVCVPQSQLEGVLRLARRLGYLDQMVDPMERVTVSIRCKDTEQARAAAKHLREHGFDASETMAQFPDQIACVLGRAEMPELVEVLAELGIEQDAISYPNPCDPVEAACAETPEKGKQGHLEPEDLDRDSLLERPATERQIDAINRLVEEGRASRDEVRALGANPTIDEASDFLYMHGVGSPRSVAPPDLQLEREQERGRQVGQREVIADGEVRTVMAEDREAPQTASIGEDSVDLPGGPDDTVSEAGDTKENPTLEKQLGDIKSYEEAKRRQEMREAKREAPDRDAAEPSLEER